MGAIDNYAIYLVLLTLPFALLTYGISVKKKRLRIGQLAGVSIIFIPTFFLIAYIIVACHQPGTFCELIGFLYVVLIVEALILALLFLGLSSILRRLLQPK